ncbi:Mn2+/Fe2+ NRAMP family transporter [Stackebrandtia albiflava]|uniref:Mn2+/Fe2+ NRAMP family transporter n=1 Tax=Stackebrandtia albiflava TaxID=406432 RepID=A0A562V517_9ACTN|nr:divalent metal cation transporter [Stackebrandtia albiflava]TWJ12994.1 Mn2+/Fe2+ NRAMP family transporter [Stackebrandtia albiflava]
MKKLLTLALAILSAVGGFVDIGDVVAGGTIGARYGLALLWVLILGVIGVACYAEMAGRVVAVSGRPLFDLVRERLGPTAALWNLLATMFVTLLTLGAQIGGIALVIELASDIPHVVWVIPIGLVVWFVLWRVKFQTIESVFGFAGLTILVFALSIWWLDPNWSELFAQATRPAPPAGEPVPTYFYHAVALFASAMTPYTVLFFSSGGVEEGWKPSQLRQQRLNVMLGFPLGGVLSLGIMAAAAVALEPTGMDVSTLGQIMLPVALAFGVVGVAAALLGFLGATLGATFEAALSCGYALGQYFGWTWGKRVAPERAARFHVSLMVSLAIAVLFIQTGVDPILVTEYSLLFSAVALPLTYLPVLVVANDRTYMGEHVNGRFGNFVGVSMLVVVVVAAVTAIPLMIGTGMGA